MKYCFILAHKRYEYFNLAIVLKYVSVDTQIIAIVPEQYIQLLSTSVTDYLHKIYVVKSLEFQTCHDIIKNHTDGEVIHQNTVIVCTDEKILMLAARLREYFNLVGARPYQLVTFQDKRKMKQALMAKQIRVSNYMDFDGENTKHNLTDYHNYLKQILMGSYIIKPLVGGSSANTAKIDSDRDLINWYANSYLSENEYAVEEYITGSLYHCDSFVINGDIKFSQVYENIFPPLDFLSGKPMGTFPLLDSSLLKNRILAFNQTVLDVLKPPNGATHLEVIVSPSNEIVFIEIGARPPGAAINLVHEQNYGISLYEQTLRMELGLELNLIKSKNLYHAWMYLSCYPGVIKELNRPPLNSKYSIKWHVQVGDRIQNFPRSIIDGIAAEILFHNVDYNELLQDLNLLKEHKPYTIFET